MSTPRKSPPPPARLGTPLDEVNDGFHAAYAEARGDAQLDAPVFVVLADSLVLFRGRERTETRFTPPLFHVIKSAAHAPVAIYAALHRLGDAPLDAATRRALTAMREKIDASTTSLGAERAEAPALVTVRVLLDASRSFIDGVLASGVVAAEGLHRFAAETGPALLRSTDEATRVQLDALNAVVAQALGRMASEDRRCFQVVVAGDHQARVRSLAMQYFGKLLGEEPEAERRMTYAEGVEDEAEALALVGTRRLDRAIAEAFFGDPNRLQRDVLGDAVHQQIQELAVPPLI